MKLKVGNYYVCRDNEDCIKVRVDAIRPELTNCEAVACTAFHQDGSIFAMDYTKDGRIHENSTNSSFDLVSEYEEPRFCLTEEHVGRRMRLNNGEVVLLTYYGNSSGDILIYSGGMCWYPDGRFCVGDRDDLNIKEILP